LKEIIKPYSFIFRLSILKIKKINFLGKESDDKEHLQMTKNNTRLYTKEADK